jgi:hypothetical protein
MTIGLLPEVGVTDPLLVLAAFLELPHAARKHIASPIDIAARRFLDMDNGLTPVAIDSRA